MVTIVHLTAAGEGYYHVRADAIVAWQEHGPTSNVTTVFLSSGERLAVKVPPHVIERAVKAE